MATTIITGRHTTTARLGLVTEAGGRESPVEEGFEGAEGAAKLVALNRAIRAIQDVDTGDDVMSTPSDAAGAMLQSFLAEQAQDTGKVVPLAVGGPGLEAQFDSTDFLGWSGSFFSWWRKFDKSPFLPPPSQPKVIAGPVRIGMVADWGTGLYGAPHCAATLRADADGFDIYLHLGDVYYSGTPREMKDRFVPHWPDNARRFNRALNGNHEMYGGGHGLFRVVLPHFKQDSSCFWIELDRFVLVGLDTGYDDHDLGQGQAEWLRHVVSRAGDKKVVLFSHHQPYSLFEGQGPNLIAKIGDLLTAGRIFAWYWGHEHRLVVFDPHPAYGGLRGRCLGHGGMPYFRDTLPGMGGGATTMHRVARGSDVPAGWVLDGPNRYLGTHANKYGPNGYVTLRFDGARLAESFRLPDGTELAVSNAMT